MSKTRNPRPVFAFYLGTSNRYDVRRLVASIVVLTDDGPRNLNASHMRWDYPGFEGFADLMLTAYVRDDEPYVSTTEPHYEPYQVQPAQAEAMARTFRRIERAMPKLVERFGYVPGDDFAGRLVQLGSILGIEQFAWPSDPGGDGIMRVTNTVVTRDIERVRAWVHEQVERFAPASSRA